MGDYVSWVYDALVVCDLACEVLVVVLESVCCFADDNEFAFYCRPQEPLLFVIFEGFIGDEL